MKPEELLRRIEAGNRANVSFGDFEALVAAFGFVLHRQAGSHRIYHRPGVPEILDLQTVGSDAKPYQIRDFVRLVHRYGLRLQDRE